MSLQRLAATSVAALACDNLPQIARLSLRRPSIQRLGCLVRRPVALGVSKHT